MYMLHILASLVALCGAILDVKELNSRFIKVEG